MIVIYLALGIWFTSGLYGVFANIERIPRVWGKRSKGDTLQHVATFFLGPLGIFFVLETGGRWDFWRKKEK